MKVVNPDGNLPHFSIGHSLFSEDSGTSSKCVSRAVVLFFLSRWQNSNMFYDDENQFYFFFSLVVPFVAGIWYHLPFGQKVPQVWTMWLCELCSLFIKTALFETELMSFQLPFVAFEIDQVADHLLWVIQRRTKPRKLDIHLKMVPLSESYFGLVL